MLTGSTTVKSAIKKVDTETIWIQSWKFETYCIHFSNKVKHLCWRGALSMSAFHIFSLPVSDYESQEVFKSYLR